MSLYMLVLTTVPEIYECLWKFWRKEALINIECDSFVLFWVNGCDRMAHAKGQGIVQKLCQSIICLI